jgi:hypothetical protein
MGSQRTALGAGEFWTRLTSFGDYGYEYSSLADISSEAHVVVVGRITGFAEYDFRPFDPTPPEAGDTWSWPMLVAIAQVSTVLKGEVAMREAGFVEIAIDAGPDDMEFLLAHLPSNEHVFFLMNDYQQRRELGYPSLDESNERYRYWRPNGYQAVLPIVNGRVAVIGPQHEWEAPYASRFPAELDGTLFETLSRDITLALSGH